MANLIENQGVWAPVKNGSLNKTFDALEITIDFDDSDTDSIMYTSIVGKPIGVGTVHIWNVLAQDCADTTDITVFWQGTDDPDIAAVTSGKGADVSATDTGWTSVAVADLTANQACDPTVVSTLDAAGVWDAKYVRFKYVLATANPGDVDIICRLSGFPSLQRAVHSTAL